MESADERPLPPGWVRYVDAESGEPYYHNAELKETTWDHPGRWKVGLFFDSLRTQSRGNKDEWSAFDGEDDLALRRRLSERIEVLRSEESRGDGEIATLRDELGRRRERLERLRQALDSERRKAAELMVAAGGETVSAAAKKNGRRRSQMRREEEEEELRCLRLQVADLQRKLAESSAVREDDDLDETIGDVDAVIEDVANLEAAGLSPRMAALLRTRPWDDELMNAAVREDVALEWQARPRGLEETDDDDSVVAGVVGVASEEEEEEELEEEDGNEGSGLSAANGRNRSPSWVSPLDLERQEEDYHHQDSIPAALRRPKRFPKTKKFLSRNSRSRSLFTDANASTSYESLEKAAKLPGTSWQWLSGWRIEGGPDGWIYGDVRSLAKLASAVDEALVVGASSAASRVSTSVEGFGDEDDESRFKQSSSLMMRCRRWRRTRALVTPPSDPKKSPDAGVCVVARKLLELRAHSASLDVLASKLSDQLVSTKAALDASERKAARLPALEAALVETSSNLRDTELRRDALQRQLVATAGIHSSSSRQLLADAPHTSAEDVGDSGSSSSTSSTEKGDNARLAKNNPFVDDDKGALVESDDEHDDDDTVAAASVEPAEKNIDRHLSRKNGDKSVVVSPGDDEDTVEL